VILGVAAAEAEREVVPAKIESRKIEPRKEMQPDSARLRRDERERDI